MVYTVSKMWASCLVSSTLFVLAMSAGNEYLPPSKGYNYDKPPIPFPPSVPNKPPTPPAVRPPVTKPPPSYIPPTSGYNHGNEIHDQTSHHDHHDHGDSHDHGDHHHHEPGMPFDFSYQVAEDGNDYSHNAISDGDVTRGEYRVALPDGRTQIVKYTADWKNGFNAQVTYEGEAKYPDQPAYGSGPAGYNRPSSGPGQAYVPPSQGGGYQY